MFDTQTTDYKITDPSCPFHTSPYADITRSLYDEFRKRGMAISVYFSKPDWHSDDYWHRAFGTAPTRNVNERITLRFGSASGLVYQNETDGSLTARITLCASQPEGTQ